MSELKELKQYDKSLQKFIKDLDTNIFKLVPLFYQWKIKRTPEVIMEIMSISYEFEKCLEKYIFETKVPEEFFEDNREIIEALSMWRVSMKLIRKGVEKNDEALLTQSEKLLREGRAIIERPFLTLLDKVKSLLKSRT